MENNNVFIITGNQGEGKTTFLKGILSELKQAGIKTAGFYAEGKWKDNVRVKFDIVDIQSNHQRLLCCDEVTQGFEKVGRFYFNPETIRWGEDIITKAKSLERCVFVIDEIGKFELNRKVWYSLFYDLLQQNLPLLITVRKEILEQVIQFFSITNPVVFELNTTKKAAAQIIAERLNLLI